MARRGGCCMYFNIFTSIIATLGGLSAFVVFFFYFKNREAGMWAFVAGVFSATTLFIHILYKRHTLELWYTPDNLQQFKVLGCVGLIAGLCGLSAYIALASTRHEDFPSMDNISTNFYIKAIWSLLAMKAGGSLFGFSHLYRKRLLEEYHPLLA